VFRARIALFDRKTGEVRTLTEKWEASPAEMQWSKDMKSMYIGKSFPSLLNSFCTTSLQARKQIFSVDVESGNPTPLVTENTNTVFY